MTTDPCELYAAITSNKISLVNKLIENGAFVNYQNEQGNTPLHIAVQKGDSYYTRLLIVNGAEVDLPNSEGKTPLGIARTLKPKLVKEIERVKQQGRSNRDAVIYLSITGIRKINNRVPSDFGGWPDRGGFCLCPRKHPFAILQLLLQNYISPTFMSTPFNNLCLTTNNSGIRLPWY